MLCDIVACAVGSGRARDEGWCDRRGSWEVGGRSYVRSVVCSNNLACSNSSHDCRIHVQCQLVHDVA